MKRLMAKRSWVFIGWVAILFNSSLVKADGESREVHRIGVYASANDPFISFYGGNVAFNIFSFLRINGGIGSGSFTVQTSSGPVPVNFLSYGGGVKLFLPNSGFSPSLGAAYSWTNVNATGSLAGSSGAFGLTANTSTLLLSFGLDWQTHSGFMMGAGYSLPISPSYQGLPYLNLGWFF